MALSGAEQAALVSVFEEIKPKYQEIGGEAMDSLFKNHPDTKSQFINMDVTPGSKDLKTFGGDIMDAIDDALKDYEKINETLTKFREQLKTKTNLKLNGVTMKLLSPSLVTAITKYSSRLDNVAFEKFLNEVAINMNDA